VQGKHILELGVGTGKHLRFHSPGKEITAIDISEKLLARARRVLRPSGRLPLLDHVISELPVS
jgi:ubiquinone/menaquinone biosynthesis C-methylase UbiE